MVVEVEAGRGARSNAVYRDLIRAALIVGTQYLVLGVMNGYRHSSSGRYTTVHSYEDTHSQIAMPSSPVDG